MSKWLEGTKNYASSQIGIVETQLIITSFITLGLVLGTVERHLSGDGIFAFILFAFALLQFISVIGIRKLYLQLKAQEKFLKKMNGDGINGRTDSEKPEYTG